MEGGQIELALVAASRSNWTPKEDAAKQPRRKPVARYADWLILRIALGQSPGEIARRRGPSGARPLARF